MDIVLLYSNSTSSFSFHTLDAQQIEIHVIHNKLSSSLFMYKIKVFLNMLLHFFWAEKIYLRR